MTICGACGHEVRPHALRCSACNVAFLGARSSPQINLTARLEAGGVDPDGQGHGLGIVFEASPILELGSNGGDDPTWVAGDASTS